MVSRHAADEEVHRPAAAQPDLNADPPGHRNGIGDLPQLAPRAVRIHARDRNLSHQVGLTRV
jgi:hypothetical protein